MACSKLFSGDLPELINEIIQYFQNDFLTLHSCILVNRLWCRLAIPLLWKDPFSIKFPRNHHFIEIYLHNLNEDDKKKLNDYVTHNDLLPSKTLFNYPSFIQRLDTYKVWHSVENWVAAVGTSTTKEQHSSYFIRNTNLSHLQMSNFAKFIRKSLILIFIESRVNLHSFELLYDTEIGYLNEIFELILQNPSFICNIKNFRLDLDEATDNIARLLEFINSNCNSISSFNFLFPSYTRDSDCLIIEKSLSQFINSQGNLKKILFGYNGFPLYHSLLSLKHPNCSNMLNTIIFYQINFKNIVVLSEVFNQLNVLESIHIVHCYSLDSKFFQQINNITKPFKLKSLFLYEMTQIELLEPFIQKSGNYLENFGISRGEFRQLLQLIIKYCNKIKYLGPIRMDDQSIHLLFNLIESITKNLNYLMIDDYCYSSNYIVPIILQNLGQILPFKLEYLNLNLMINTSDLEPFLKNSQNTYINKLLIRNKKKTENDDIFPYIKEYIMKKKRVKYLAVVEYFNGKNENLFSLKDKVREFQLHDIQVVNYNDLFIDIYDFVYE
jgi:hypothetical protein